MGKVILIDSLKKNQVFRVLSQENKTFVIFLVDGKSQEGELEIIIDGKFANVQILGIIIGFGNQRINFYSLQNHVKGDSKSDLLIKSVLFDNARLNYEGLIRIEKGAQRSNAYQKNQNILLSTQASVESKPYLEILADDVRCTHGASIGQIDRNHLYYLRTRGIDEKTAKMVLIFGFFQDVLERIEDSKLRKNLEEILYRKIFERL